MTATAVPHSSSTIVKPVRHRQHPEVQRSHRHRDSDLKQRKQLEKIDVKSHTLRIVRMKP
jgi:hypothetical protein